MLLDLVLTPALMLAACVPSGAAIVRLAWRDAEEPPLLLAVPVGFSLLVLVLEGCRVVIGGTPGWVLPLVAAAGIAAAVVTRAFVRARELVVALGASLLTYAGLTAPVWLQAGRTVMLGYNRNNDPVFLTVMAQLIAHGHEAIPPPYVTDGYLSYPAGSMDVIAAFASTLGRSAFAVTVPVHAITVALLVPCVAALLPRLGAVAGRWTPALAVLAIIGVLPVSYYGQTATSSMMMLVPLLGALLLTWDAVHEKRPLAGALAGFCAGAAVTVYGLSTLGWIAAFAAVLVAYELSQNGLPAVRPLLLTGAAAVIGGIPAFPGAVRAWRFQLEVADTVKGGLVLGNLGQALDPLLAVGVDRSLLPVLTLPAFGVAGGLMLAGVGWTMSRGRVLGLMLLFACAFTVIYATLAGPYYVAKALVPASIVLAALAGVGATRLWPALRDHRRLGIGLLVLLAVWGAGAVYTAGYYLDTTAKSPAWLDQLGAQREAIAARGPALIVSPNYSTWTAWELRNPGLRLSLAASEGASTKPSPAVLARYATVIVEPGGTAPGAPFRRSRRIGDVEIYTR